LLGRVWRQCSERPGIFGKRIALGLVLHWDQSIVNGFGVNNLANTL